MQIAFSIYVYIHYIDIHIYIFRDIYIFSELVYLDTWTLTAVKNTHSKISSSVTRTHIGSETYQQGAAMTAVTLQGPSEFRTLKDDAIGL